MSDPVHNNESSSGHSGSYKANSLSLMGAVAMGTGVMIGAGIFALTGQIAEQAGGLFPYAFLAAALVTGCSAYSYVKLSNAFPSAGGIAAYLEKAYGKGLVTAGCALLMYFSMVMAIAKVAGVALFAIVGLWLADLSVAGLTTRADSHGTSFIASIALGILAYKGFTTITNSGAEIKEPHRNVGRAIIISILICVVLYFFMAWAVASMLSVDEIIAAKDYALAEAARPLMGQYGVWFTVGLAIVATVSGVIASAFAVSRVLAMLTEMKLVPHRHFGMPGRVQKHTLVYTIVIAMGLTIFFDLGRIASLGAIFYLVMDIAVHWGVLRHLRREVKANAFILSAALILDVVVLAAFVAIKAGSDPVVLYISLVGMGMIFGGEWLFLRWRNKSGLALQ